MPPGSEDTHPQMSNAFSPTSFPAIGSPRRLPPSDLSAAAARSTPSSSGGFSLKVRDRRVPGPGLLLGRVYETASGRPWSGWRFMTGLPRPVWRSCRHVSSTSLALGEKLCAFRDLVVADEGISPPSK